MICLGIESTAHTLGIGIVEGRKVLANAKSMYRPPEGQGILPRAAADHHAQAFNPVLRQALSDAGVALRDIGLFSFSQGPGIGQCLRVSCTGAKFLSSVRNKPILGINHCHAHLEISRGLLGMEDPLYVYVSGANTQLIVENREKPAAGRFSAPGRRIGNRGAGSQRFLVLGETLDMGLGNLFDVFAREARLARQHGSEVARLASEGRYFELPYTVKGMNFAFAGLLTSAKRSMGERRAEDIACSLLETSFAEICEAAERALCLTGKSGMVVCGGVAQNARFCKMLSEVCKSQGAAFGAADPQFNADNGAMIAYTAICEWGRGKRQKLDALKPNGYWRIDEVE
ncbi:tRNA N6-adenosine threonylcarbamoyltransferase [uncultured archaeon]|nr:tRNA N6-adenosine threonylcarbamoyltransferase [uncultured archaeon]